MHSRTHSHTHTLSNALTHISLADPTRHITSWSNSLIINVCHPPITVTLTLDCVYISSACGLRLKTMKQLVEHNRTPYGTSQKNGIIVHMQLTSRMSTPSMEKRQQVSALGRHMVSSIIQALQGCNRWFQLGQLLGIFKGAVQRVHDIVVGFARRLTNGLNGLLEAFEYYLGHG